MKEIKLTKGKVALVDDEDFEWLSQWHWFYDGMYAARHGDNGKKKSYMHREILRPPQGMLTDHINHDCLDNRRENLRPCNKSQNSTNRPIQINNTSGHKGVSLSFGKWHTYINTQGKRVQLGRFEDFNDACRAYDEAAQKYFGEFAYIGE